MRLTQILIIVMLYSTSGFTQVSIGLEVRSSRNVTYNSSKIEGGGSGFGGYEVIKEGNPTTSSYSIGITYSPNMSNTFKLHIGRHQNGRILDLSEHDDTFSLPSIFEKVDLPYTYLQITPSYAFNLQREKYKIPIELGFAINKIINEEDTFYIGINEYNYDLRISSGIHYKLNNISIGSNVVFSKSVNNYASKFVDGEYLPNQIGIEVALGYTFKIERNDNITNDE